MNYKKTDNTLHKLMEINWEVKKKEDEIKGSKKFNRTALLNNKFDIAKLVLELQELELEFKRKSREL